jgi:hypothetical protein
MAHHTRPIRTATVFTFALALSCSVMLLSTTGCATRDSNGWAQQAPSISPSSRDASLAHVSSDLEHTQQ